MSIYISPLQRSGIHRFYIVVADRHSELQTAANFYASRIIKVNQKNSYIVVPERKRLFGLALESNVVTPLNPRTNPFDFSNDRGGGLAGDSRTSGDGRNYPTGQTGGRTAPSADQLPIVTSSGTLGQAAQGDIVREKSTAVKKVYFAGRRRH